MRQGGVMPKVSIIMPLYNQEKYIVECIESVINQKLKDIEIIVVNDGSTDQSPQIIKGYENKDKRIKIINKQNSGYGHSMNQGIDAATGEYIGIVETDDYVSLDMFDTLYKVAYENQLDFVKADFYRFYGEGKDRKNEYGELHKDKSYYNRIIDAQEDLTIFELTMMNWSGIYKTEFLRSNNIRHNETPGASYQDNGFWFQVFSLAHKIMFIDQPLYHVRRDNPNSSINNKAKVFCISEEYDFIYDFLSRDTAFKQKYLERYYIAKYANYVGVLNRIANEFKERFYIKFARDFSNGIKIGEVKKEYFSEKAWQNIITITKKYGFEEPILPDVNVKRDYNYLSQLNPAYYPEELEIWYERITKHKLDLLNPITMNDKIQWSKLYDSNPHKSQLADKFMVRKWVIDSIGEEFLIPLLGVWKNFDEIDFDFLPNQFVLKLNNGSGWNAIILDKSTMKVDEIQSKFNNWIEKDFSFEFGLELQYGLIEPLIIAEKYLENNHAELTDYKFLCVDGKVMYIWVDTDRYTDHRRDVFDREWVLQDCYLHCPHAEKVPQKPKNLEGMINIAEKLAEGFSYVRIDLYELDNGDTKFGEITFTSSSGTEQFIPPEINVHIGEKIKLPIYNSPSLKPKITVVLPVFNAEKTIRQCLNSILCQKEKEIEILCIDNASNDKTYKILQEYVIFDRRVRILDQVSNDFSQSRDYAIRIAKGEIIVFLNQNNIYKDNDIFSIAYEKIRSGVDVVFCDEYLWKNRRANEKNSLYINSEYDKNISSEKFIGLGIERAIIRRDIITSLLMNKHTISPYNSIELFLLIINQSKVIQGIKRTIYDFDVKEKKDSIKNLNQNKENISTSNFVAEKKEESTNLKTINLSQAQVIKSQSENIISKEKQIEVLRREIEEIHKSKSYKIGRLITWPLRIVRKAFKCYRENGLKYTLNKISFKSKQVFNSKKPGRIKSPKAKIIFSVIIPVYNAASYLEECIESLINQTMVELEFIFVDDGSSDNSSKIIKAYAKKDKRIRLLSQKNQGAGIARNKGIRAAKGEYLHFLDADDWVDLNIYSSIYNKLKVEYSDVCMFFYRTFDNVTGNFLSVYSPIKDPKKYVMTSMREKPMYFLNNSFVIPWNKVYKRKFILNNSLRFTNLNCSNDRPFYFEVLLKANKIMVLDAVLINYRINNNSSLVGENRSKNYHCQFLSFELSEPKYRQESPEIYKKFLQISMGDFFYFFSKAKGEDKAKIENMLKEYFKKLDLTPIGKEITNAWWYPEYNRIRTK